MLTLTVFLDLFGFHSLPGKELQNVVRITSFVTSVITSTAWVTTLLYLSYRHHRYYQHPAVWVSGIRDFCWYNSPPAAGTQDPDVVNSSRSLRTWLIGAPRSREAVRTGFLAPVAEFVFHHTPWRRVVGVEPIWLSLARGTTGVACLLGLSAYACIQCISLPLRESYDSLPLRETGTHGEPLLLADVFVALVSTKHVAEEAVTQSVW